MFEMAKSGNSLFQCVRKPRPLAQSERADVVKTLFGLGCLIGLVSGAGAEPLVEGRVRLDSGDPVAGARVMLFDLADLGAAPLAATTDRSGHFTLPLAVRAGARPERFELGANYPNPFNPSTVIPYQLPASMRVRLEVLNILGQRIATLVDGEQPAGFHTATWDATDAAGVAVGAGVYIYRLRGAGVQATRSMLLIDGQAGIRSAGPGEAVAGGGKTGAGGEGETAPVYGLTVSGPGLVPYVDPAFRVETGMPPLELVVEGGGSLPPAKVTSSGGVLGDVDNTGGVDFFDALLVALYSRDSSIVMPNNGDISLGDVDADGQVDLSDAWLIAAWLNDSSDPSLPSGIGAPVGPAASLSPDPSTVTFADDGAWHRFTVEAGERVSVVVNPAGTPLGLEITARSGRGNFCPAEADDDVRREGGQAVYLSGCVAGEATVELRRESDGTVLRTYTFEVTGSPADLVVESVSVSDSTLTPGQSFTLSATVRNQGTGRSAATTLQYYRSSNRTISTRDTQVGTDAVGALAAAGTSAESISLTAPSAEGTYYYGACVVSVGGESGGNNCSSAKAVTVQSRSRALTIPDANLRAAIEAALGKSSGATIAVAEMEGLTGLWAEGADISDLTGLEFATNLRYLYLTDNNIEDISALSGLLPLEQLNLDSNNIEDISALSALTQLVQLDLLGNNIEDISALSGLTRLVRLGLVDNNIEDITGLSRLYGLRYLNLAGNNIEDISALSRLAVKLQFLYLHSNNIEDISALSGLTNLLQLVLEWNSIEDISVLSGLTKLSRLDLSGNNIESIPALSDLTSLATLDLDRNNIEDIAGLSGLTNLREWLDLSYNNIQDISALSGLTNLSRLDLSHNNIEDISALSGLNLRGLLLAENRVEDISALSGHRSLTDLYLWFNNIEDISALSDLGRLTEVELRWNPLNESSVNDHIPALERRGVRVFYTPQNRGDFDIELVYLEPFTEAQERALQLVVKRWMSVITEDLPDYELTQGYSGECGGQSFQISAGERIDDLRIYVGALPETETRVMGRGGPFLLRETTYLPVLGCMTINLERANLLVTGLHEIGHVLGFGPIWDDLGLLRDLSWDNPNADTHFNGSLAIAAFNDAGGSNYPGAKVPVQQMDGAHWRFPVLDGELMGPSGGGELSVITVQSLADLGYGVHVASADPYTLSPSAAGKASAKIAAALPSTSGMDVTQANAYAHPHWPGSFAEGLPSTSSIADERLRGRQGRAEEVLAQGLGLHFRHGRLMGRLPPHPTAKPMPSCGLPGWPVYVVDEQGVIIRRATAERAVPAFRSP